MKCQYNYKGKTYSEEEVKPIVSYHYLVEDALLQNDNIIKTGNVLQVNEIEDFGDSPVLVTPDVSDFVEKINDTYAESNPVVTVNTNGIIDIDVNYISDKILHNAQLESTSDNISNVTQSRKKYNLEGVDEETLAGMEAKVSLMEQRFNDLGVVTHFVMDGDLNASGQLLGTGSERYKAMVANGEITNGDAVVVVNPNQLFSDTVLHEYGHLFIDLMGGINNVRIKYAYSKIKNSPLAEQVKEQYPELSGDALAKEIMATALGKEATEIFEAGNSEIGFFQKFLNWIREGLANIFGIQTTTVKDLANELLGITDSTLQANGSMDTDTQNYKAYTKDIPKVERVMKGAEITLEKVKSKINVSLNALGTSSREDIVEFKSSVRALSEEIEKYSKTSNLLALDAFVGKATIMGNKIEERLKEELSNANKGGKTQLDFNFLNEIDYYVGLFDVVEEIRNSAISGYFEQQFEKEGWGTEQNEQFTEAIDKAQAQINNIHDLRVKVGRHHIADKLAKYSNRRVVSRRVELENEFKESNPRMDGETRTQYNARIRSKVDEAIREELPELKRQERELIYNRLESSPSDISTFASWVSSEKDLNSMVIQLASKLLDEADLKRDLEMQAKKIEAVELFNAFDKETSGLGAKEKYKGLYQEGSDGNLYYTTEYNVEFYIQLQKLNTAVYDAEEKHTRESKEYKDAVNAKNNFLQNNTTHVTEGLESFYKPNDKWKNKDYTNIMSKPESAKAKMLQFMIKGSEDNSKMLHGNRSLVKVAPQTNVSFIRVPSIGRNTFEKATDGDILSNIKDSFERLYRAKTDDTDLVGDVEQNLESEKRGLKVIANRKGDIKYGVPIHFRGEMPLSQISYDLMSSHMMDSYMAMNYKHKSALQIELELMKDITAEKSITQTTGFTKKVFLNALDKVGASEVVRKASEQSNELTVLQSIIENRLYGIKTADKEYAKIAGTLMSWSASTMLMVNLPSAMVNVMQGKVFNFIEGVANEFFTTDDLKKAELDFFRDSKNWLNDIGRQTATSKTNQLMEILNIQGEFKALSAKMIENTRFKALMNSNTAFGMNHMGEMYMHGTLMYAILNNVKVKNSQDQFIDKDGKVTTKDKAMNLSEAISLDDKGNLTLNKHVYKTSFGNSTFSLNPKDMGLLEIKGLINKLAHDLHGNYNSEIQNMAQRYVVGKFVMMLRKWIVPGFNRRWRGASYANPFSKDFVARQGDLRDQIDNFYSEDLQAFQEGYYTTGLRLLTNISKDLKTLKFEAFSKNWDQLSDMELANMRRLLTEMTIMITSLLSSYILLGLAKGIDDDDENTRQALFHLTYYTRRIYSELQFYSNPIEAFKIMSTPAASMSYVVKLGRLVDQALSDVHNVTFGEGLEEYQVGKRKGQYKIHKKIGDVLPIVNQYNRDIEESTGWLFSIY